MTKKVEYVNTDIEDEPKIIQIYWSNIIKLMSLFGMIFFSGFFFGKMNIYLGSFLLFISVVILVVINIESK